MAAVDLPAVSPGSVTASSDAASSSRKGLSAHEAWFVSPWFDLLLIANVCWPLLLLVEWYGGTAAGSHVRFWQIYFVTTPHRWVTLALVFLDRDRLQQRPIPFPLVASIAVAPRGGGSLGTGRLTCLLAIDYVWNAWHFAAQHHGIYRIYARRTTPDRLAGFRAEKWLMRALIVYVALRIAGWSWSYQAVEAWLHRTDYLVA